MPIYDLRILLETVEGKKTSYFSSGSSYNSFVDTDTDGLVLSSSQAYGRITGSVSCSFINDDIFVGNVDTNKVFKQNNVLSASLVGGLDTGSIIFTAKTDEYDRLLRYKFIGDKVCTVLGLPSNQWVYVDQFRLPADDESNILQGNFNIGNAFVSDTLTFANNANVNSDIPFYIDTGSDRYIKFIDTRDTGKVSLIFGYDKDTDTYEINAATGSIFNIKNVNNLDVDRVNAAQVNMVTSSTETSIETSFGDLVVTGSTILSGTAEVLDTLTMNAASINLHHNQSVRFNSQLGGSVNDRIFFFPAGGGNPNNQAGLIIQTQTSGAAVSNNLRINTLENSGETLTVEGSISSSGDIITTGNVRVAGDITAENYIVSSSIMHITTSFSDGSTIFGDTPSDDTHKFTGSLDISGSGTDLTVNGNVGIGTSTPDEKLEVIGNISASGNLLLNGGITASTDIVLDNYLDTAIRFIDGTGGVSNNFLNYRQWKTSATGGKEITNATGIIKLESKNVSNGLVISGSNVGIGTTTPSKALGVAGDISASGFISTLSHITASGDISASGDLILGGKIEIDGGGGLSDAIIEVSSDTLRLKDKGNVNVIIDSDGSAASGEFRVRAHSGESTRFIVSSSGNVGIGTTTPSKALEVEGDISASGDFIGKSTSTGSFGSVETSGNISASGTVFASAFSSPDGDGDIDFSDSIDITGNITASGNISSSGLGFFGGSIGVNGVSQSLSTFTTYPGLYVKQSDTDGGPLGSQNILIGGVGDIAPSNAKLKMYLADGTDDGVLTTYQFGSSLKLKAGVSSSVYPHNWSQILIKDTGTTTSAPDGFIQFWTSGSQRAVIDENGKFGIGTTTPTKALQVEGDISASGDLFVNNITASAGNFLSHITSSGNISASGTQHVLGGRLDIRAAANNTTLLKITDIDQQNNLNFAIDANQHSDLHIEKDGVDKIRFNTYWPAQIDNDSYETFGGLILGSDADRGDKTGFGLYVSAGPDSGSIYTKERVFIGVGGATGSNDMLSVGGNITTTSHITASGNISASGKITGDDFEFNLPTDNNRKFKGFDNNGVRLQNTSGGWAMEYGFLGSGGTDLGGFGGHGGTGLTKFYIGRRYDRPLVSFFSGSSNDGVLIGHFDNTEGAPKTLTVQGDISSSGHIHLENQKAIFFRTNNATSYISSSDSNFADLSIRAADDMNLIADDVHIRDHITGTVTMTIANNENFVGIGNTSPSKKLTVGGDISASGDLNITNITSSGNLVFSGSDGNPSVINRGVYFGTHTGTIGYIRSQNNMGSQIEIGSDNVILFKETDNNSEKIRFDMNSGKVGIGTTSPANNDALLTVAGNISASAGNFLSHITSSGNISASGNGSFTGTLRADGNVDFNGDLDVDGTTNLDNTDIDGTFKMDGTTFDVNGTAAVTIDTTDTSNGITIGETSGTPVKIGHTNSVTTINDELDVTGTVDINDTTDSTSKTTGALKVDGGVGIVKNLSVGGNISASGDVIAQNYIVNSTITNITTSFSEGSTQFGDTMDDTHQFTGSVDSSGSISSIGSLYQARIDNGSTAGPRLELGSNTDPDSFLSIEASGGQNKIDTTNRDFHLFGTNTTTGFYFDESVGKFGIGTTSPTSKLEVEGVISASGGISSSGNISIPDNSILNVGTGNDLQIKHNGSNSFITDTGTGDLYIRAADNLRIQATSTNEDMIKAVKDGGIELYHNNSKTLEVTSSGVNVTGHITASGNISASGTIQSTGDISAVTSTGSFGRIQGTGSATEMVLSQDIVTTLNSSVGTIDDGETISAGTSIEQLLRNMLQDFVPPVLSSFSITNLDSFIEVGDSEPDTINSGIFVTASSTSHLTGFENNGGSFALSLSGNATSDGAISANYSGNSTGTISFTSPSSITVKRTTLGTVIFTLTGTDNNPVGTNNVTTKTDTIFFRHPIFYGGTSNDGTGLNSTVLSSILGDISSSVSSKTGTNGIEMQTTNDATFGDQTLINTSVTDNLPTDMTLILPSSVADLNNFTYIIYPVSYGEIADSSGIIKNDSFDETDSFELLGTATHQRFTGVNTTYRVYKSKGRGAFQNGDKLKIND